MGEQKLYLFHKLYYCHRGFLVGRANITFGKTVTGERLYIFSDDPKAAKDKIYTLETNTGNECILQLPDGTILWMYPNSSIHFPAHFSSDTIQVGIAGKVYFETSPSKHLIIAANPPSQGFGGQSGQRPTTYEIQVEPSAAAFDLSAYPGDSVISINTISGTARVTIQSQSAGQSLQLEPGKQITIIHGMPSLYAASDTSEILALKNGEINLKDVSLQTILSTVKRWYDVEIHYEAAVPDEKFSLRVPLEAKLSVIVDSLRKQGAHIMKQGKIITIAK